MELNISNEILKLIQKSQTTVMKLYQFVNGQDSIPTAQEFKKFQNGLIASIRKKKENALELFPIIKYFESKNLTDDDIQYDNVLFTVPEDQKIAIASPIEVLDEMPNEDDSYDLHIPWDQLDIYERESKLIKAAENYFNIIKKDKALKKFVKYIGTNVEINLEFVENEKDLFLENIPQELFALYQSNDLNNLLPIEVVQLDDKDLEVVFLKNFIESKLLTYQLWGIQREIFEEWVIKYKDKGDIGPLFICLDTSGSMRGLTEIIAKAITMFICNELEENFKNIVFVPFSMDAKFYDLSNDENKTKKLKMLLRKSYYGGTSLEKLFEVIDNWIYKQKYAKSNILIISDFIFKNLNQNIINKINKIKKSGHKVHGLNISDKNFKNKITQTFNSYWSYTFNWRGVYENNENELINKLLVANPNSISFQDIKVFGVIKKLKDNDFIAKNNKENTNDSEKEELNNEENNDKIAFNNKEFL